MLFCYFVAFARGENMKEKEIESYLRNRTKAEGGKAYKWVSPGNTGVPDRIVLLPGGKIIFVELKAPGKKPTPIQLRVHEQLRHLGFDVRVIDSKSGVDAMMAEIKQ